MIIVILTSYFYFRIISTRNFSAEAQQKSGNNFSLIYIININI